jgi:hypothetical protein
VRGVRTPCDIVGCEREAADRFDLHGVIVVRPRRTTDEPIPLCAEHASTIAGEVEAQLRRAVNPRGANANRSNRAMSGEDLGDAEH